MADESKEAAVTHKNAAVRSKKGAANATQAEPTQPEAASDRSDFETLMYSQQQVEQIFDSLRIKSENPSKYYKIQSKMQTSKLYKALRKAD